MRAWMQTIVRNETHRVRQRKQSQETPLNDIYSVGTEDPSPLLRFDVERALRQLPHDQGCAVGLFYLSEWPIASASAFWRSPLTMAFQVKTAGSMTHDV